MMRDKIGLALSLEEFIERYHTEPFELINGQRIPLVPTLAEHGELLKWLYRLLLAYEMTRGTIVVYSEMPFVLSYSAEWVMGSRVPDIMIYDAERIQAYKAADREWGKKPFILVPDLCIEIVSPNDKYVEVEEKVERYLEDGVKIVWVVNPRKASVTVYRAEGDSIVRLSKDKVLQGDDVLPDFSLKVSEIFLPR